MAAGLGFKTFNTGDVLSAADTNGYLMQGVWVFASAAARDAAVTSPQEGNFAYLKDTNVTTYYTGSAWANLDTTGMTNPMTTTGDTIYSSSGSTPARLGIGSTGQVLTVAGGVPSWATPASGGGMTLISTTTLSGASTTISFTSTGYNALVFECYNIEISTNTQWNWQPNATNNICTYLGDNHTGTAVGSRSANIDTFIASSQGATWKGSDTNNAGYLFIDNPASSTSFKPFQWWVTWVNSDASTKSTFTAKGAIRSTTALSSMSLQPSSGTFSAGTVKLYGVK